MCIFYFLTKGGVPVSADEVDETSHGDSRHVNHSSSSRPVDGRLRRKAVFLDGSDDVIVSDSHAGDEEEESGSERESEALSDEFDGEMQARTKQRARSKGRGQTEVVLESSEEIEVEEGKESGSDEEESLSVEGGESSVDSSEADVGESKEEGTQTSIHVLEKFRMYCK